MKNKIVIFCLGVVILLMGCSKPVTEETQEYYDAYASINDDEITHITGSGDLAMDPSDSKQLYEVSDIVAIVTIQSIDGGSSLNEFTNNRTRPYTYGEFIVHKVIKGEVVQGEELTYLRTGGIISYSEYYNSLTPAQKEKQDIYNSSQGGYVKYTWDGDIDIVVGTTYLVYMKEISSGSREGMYPIIGWQTGLREISAESGIEFEDIDQIKAYNNYMGDWELLSEFIPE